MTVPPPLAPPAPAPRAGDRHGGRRGVRRGGRRGGRRLAVALAALPLAALTACGGSTAASTDPASATSGSTATGSGDVTTATTRVVETAFGPVEVPAEPDRVVALGDTALDTALALDIAPVGTLSSRGGTGVSAYLAEEAGDVAIVGTVREPNLEAIVTAQPDLIIAASGTPREQYDALSAIAPTVVPEVVEYGDWETETLAFAQALGQEQEARELLDGLQARAAGIAASRGAGGTAAVVRWMPTGPLVMSSSLMASRLVEATGDTVVAAADFADRPHTDPLSLENLGDVDADFLYIATLNAEGEQALGAARSQPAFARLGAAQSGQVAPVDGSYWSSAAGPLAAEAVLDDIERLRAQG